MTPLRGVGEKLDSRGTDWVYYRRQLATTGPLEYRGFVHHHILGASSPAAMTKQVPASQHHKTPYHCPRSLVTPIAALLVAPALLPLRAVPDRKNRQR